MSYYDYLHRKPIVYDSGNSDTFARRPSIRNKSPASPKVDEVNSNEEDTNSEA